MSNYITTKETAKKFCLSYEKCSDCPYANTNPEGCVVPRILFEHEFGEIAEAARVISEATLKGQNYVIIQKRLLWAKKQN